MILEHFLKMLSLFNLTYGHFWHAGDLCFFYKFSTNFSFSLKIFFNSPRVDSIFSSEYCCSPSAPRSFATQELSSLTVLSRSFHSLTRVSSFLHPSSDTTLTFSYLPFTH